MKNQCPICQAQEVYVHYDGPIRTGGFGSVSDTNHQVMGCKNCQAQWLASGGEDSSYYSTTQYIKEFDGSEEAENYFQIHDPVQLRHLDWVGTGSVRNKVVADIGCGAGAFLDFVKGLSSQTIGIDVNRFFVEMLNTGGHLGYHMIDEVDVAYRNNVDIITAFSMIEHVEKPLELAEQMRQLAHSKSRLYVSTPNADDFLLRYASEEYKQFFYRKVHLWYFNEQSLTYLLERTGWKVEKVHYVHRFGLSNFISWVGDCRPTGDVELPFVTKTMSECWRSELCAQKKSDYFCIEAVPAD